jgi:hypothetical protein
MARADKKTVNKLVETGNYLAVVSDLADCHCVEQVRLKRLKKIEYCLKALEFTDAEWDRKKEPSTLLATVCVRYFLST